MRPLIVLASILGAFLVLADAGPLARAAAPAPETACTNCHSSSEWFDDEADRRIVTDWMEGVHAEAAISCHDCHGGNPDMANSDDFTLAMDSEFAPNPYTGAPERNDIPSFCGRCHSDPNYMRKFNPGSRVDQEQEYRTSHHGLALARGDEKVATCVDCHGVHDIRHAGDAKSRVYPSRVAETCGGCHSDPQRMSGYELADGSPLPVDQHARWKLSIHAHAMFERGDLSAPTCNDCHGNHGAAPPGVDSVVNVCGQCHGREATLFRRSDKQEGFNDHNDMYLPEAGEEGCSSCHTEPEPAALQTGISDLSECVTCHGNHSVVRPTIAMLAPLPAAPCAFCHEVSDQPPVIGSESPGAQKRFEELQASLLDHADDLGLKGEERFDWLIDQALELPTHSEEVTSDAGPVVRLRPEFDRLFTKFRLGKTHIDLIDPATGQVVTERVVRCTDCHPKDGAGYEMSSAYLERMRELTSATARADRLLLTARRGGVALQEPLLELDKAVDAQIELEALVHSFGPTNDGPFAEKHKEGMEYAAAALAGAERGRQELKTRRIWLGVSLVFVLLVLIGLALKIREVSRAEAAQADRARAAGKLVS